MFDLIGDHLSIETIRYLIVWTLSVSAPMVGFLAFAVTRGAGFRCPLGLLRAAQRAALFCLAITLAYVGAYIADYGADAVPLGLLLPLFLCFGLSTLISGIRHLMAPTIAVDNTWHGAWNILRLRAVTFAAAHVLSDSPRRARPF